MAIVTEKVSFLNEFGDRDLKQFVYRIHIPIVNPNLSFATLNQSFGRQHQMVDNFFSERVPMKFLYHMEFFSSRRDKEYYYVIQVNYKSTASVYTDLQELVKSW